MRYEISMVVWMGRLLFKRSISVSISKDSRNWYMKVSVRSGMRDEYVGKVWVVNLMNPFKTDTEVMKKSLYRAFVGISKGNMFKDES